MARPEYDSIPFSNVVPGDVLIADGGFTCLPEGAQRTVYRDAETGELCVTCDKGTHGLDGQRKYDDEGVWLTGFKRGDRA